MAELAQRNYSRILGVLLWLGTIALLLAQVSSYLEQRDAAHDDTRAEVEAVAEDWAGALGEQLSLMTGEARLLGQVLLEAHPVKGAAIDALLQGELDHNRQLSGVGAAYAPAALKEGLYAPYQVRRPWGYERADAPYDYTQKTDDPNTIWYQAPADAGAPVWVPPFLGKKSQSIVVSYGHPVLDAGGALLAVLSYNMDLGGVRELLAAATPGTEGYAFLIAPNNKLLAHPDGGLVGRSFQDTGEVLEVDEGTVEYKDSLTDYDSWVACRLVSPSDWRLCAVIPQVAPRCSGAAPCQPTLAKARVRMGCAFLLVVMVTLTLLTGRGTFRSGAPVWRLWALSIGVTLAQVALIGNIWHELLRTPVEQSATDQLELAMDDATLAAVLDRYEHRKSVTWQEESHLLPTGLFLQSLAFVSGNNVELTGYVWQHYDTCREDRLTEEEQGFIMPEAIAFSAEEKYRRVSECSETVGWYFEATLRETFQYRAYPLDPKVVWVRLWHKEFSRNIVLTPDLSAYATSVPAMSPGIEDEFVLDDWTLEGAFFGYRDHGYNTNFGIDDYAGQYDFPELHFTVLLRRKFLDPFISYLVPLLIVASLLFVILLRGVKEEMSAVELVGSSSGLFFLVLLSHIQLRGVLGSPNIVYLEHFFLTMYFFILGVTVLSLLEKGGVRLPLLGRHHYLYARLLYWPLMTTILLFSTLSIV